MTPNKTPAAETAKKTTHTPGPWRLRLEDNGNFEVKDDDGRWVARVHFRSGPADGSKDGNPTAEANARLIAQAPAMLEALTAHVGFLDALVLDLAEQRGFAQYVERVRKMADDARAILAAIDGGAR